MVKTKFSWIDILIVILFVLSVYLILTRIFGHSATDLIISISLFTFLGGLIYSHNSNIMNHIVKLNREVGEIKIKVTNGFKNVAKDIKEIKNEL